MVFTNDLVGWTDMCESSQEFVQASTFADVSVFVGGPHGRSPILFILVASCGDISSGSGDVLASRLGSCHGRQSFVYRNGLSTSHEYQAINICLDDDTMARHSATCARFSLRPSRVFLDQDK